MMRLKHVGTSLFVHTLIITGFYLKNKSQAITENLVQIEIKEAPVVLKKEKAQAAAFKKSLEKNHQLQVGENSLFSSKISSQKLLSIVEKNTEGELSQKKHNLGAYNDPNTYVTGGSDFFGDDKNQSWPYFQEVYQRIDTNLVFDSLLAQYNHFGRVYVQFKITDEGLFSLEDLRADSNDPILKVHVLRAIRKSLNTKLIDTKKSKLIGKNEFRAVFNFKFGDPYNNSVKQEMFGRPVFVFNRHTLEKPVPAELLDHILTGGVTPNVSLMYERWQKYNKKKRLKETQFDPFISYRRDQFFNI